jgi:hypothetical protein
LFPSGDGLFPIGRKMLRSLLLEPLLHGIIKEHPALAVHECRPHRHPHQEQDQERSEYALDRCLRIEGRGWSAAPPLAQTNTI